MRKHLLICGIALACLSLNVLARGGGGGPGHGAPSGPSNQNATNNSNGRFAPNQQKGLDRAQDRMSQQGLQHQQATTVPKGKPGPAPAPRR